MRSAVMAVLGIALGAGAGSGSAVTAQTHPAPIVALSTLTLPTRDSIGVIVHRSKPAGTVRFRVAFRTTWLPDQGAWISTQIRDTIRLGRVVCSTQNHSQDTIRVAVIADAATASSASRTARIVLPCRQKGAADVAFLDSFPNWWAAMLPWARRLPIPRLDSIERVVLAGTFDSAERQRIQAKIANIRQGPDSILVRQPIVGDTTSGVYVEDGYTHFVCWLARNRFTGRVAVIPPDRWGLQLRIRGAPIVAFDILDPKPRSQYCESTRQQWNAALGRQ